jgi:anti-anti-sigma factor
VRGAFHVEVVHRGDLVVLRCSGEFDLSGTREFERAIGAAGDRESVVVDLRDVGFLDSSALHALLTAARHLSGRLQIVPGPPPVNRVFELTATWDRFEFVDPAVVDVSGDDPSG